MSRRSWLVAGGLVLAYLGLTVFAWSGAVAAPSAGLEREDSTRALDFAGAPDAANGGVVALVLDASISSPIIAGVQVIAFAAASSLLALATVQRLRGHWTGWVLAVLLLALSLLTVFQSSQLALESASLTLTAVTLWLASVVWLSSARRGELRPLIASAAALALLALVQPGAMLVVLPAQWVLLARLGRQERSGRAAFVTMMSTIPLAAFAIVRVWRIADRDQWPLARLIGGLVDGDASFRDYALAWAWVSTEHDFSRLWPVTWTNDAVLSRSSGSLLMPGEGPWLLVGSCLVVGALLAFLAGVRPRVTFTGVIALGLALAPPMAFMYVGWGVSGGDVGSVALPSMALAAVAALILPATIAQRPERSKSARRTALADITARWASPAASAEATPSG